jgi:hypothetical protein
LLHTARALFRFLLCVNLAVRSGRPDLMRPLVSLIIAAADTLVFFSDLLLFDLYLVQVHLLIVVVIEIPLIQELPLVQQLEVLDAELRLVHVPLEVVVQLLLVEEGVLTRQLLIQLEVWVKLMPVGVA